MVENIQRNLKVENRLLTTTYRTLPNPDKEKIVIGYEKSKLHTVRIWKGLSTKGRVKRNFLNIFDSSTV